MFIISWSTLLKEQGLAVTVKNLKGWRLVQFVWVLYRKGVYWIKPSSQLFPAVNLLVPSPLHLSLKDTQDITLFAFRDVWHTSVLPVIVVGSVLGMLSLNKLCKEKHLKL